MKYHPVVFILQMQANLKLFHWMTTSYPAHVATDKLIEAFNSIGDRFVETFIGKYGRPKLNKKNQAELLQLDEKSIVNYLHHIVTYMMHDINNFIKPTDVDLVNLRDEIIQAVSHTRYLLTLS